MVEYLFLENIVKFLVFWIMCLDNVYLKTTYTEFQNIKNRNDMISLL